MTLCLRFFEALFEFCHVTIGITITLCLAETYPVNNRSVIEGIANNGIFCTKERLKHTSVGIEASSIKNSVFGMEVLGNSTLELLVHVLRTTNETHATHTITMAIHSFLGSLDEARMITKA